MNPQERAIAPEVYRALDRARRRLESGDSDVAGIEREGLAALVKAGFRPDYFEVRMAGTLAKPHGRTSTSSCCGGAAGSGAVDR